MMRLAASACVGCAKTHEWPQKRTSIRGLEVLSFSAGNQRSYPCSSVLYVQQEVRRSEPVHRNLVENSIPAHVLSGIQPPDEPLASLICWRTDPVNKCNHVDFLALVNASCLQVLLACHGLLT